MLSRRRLPGGLMSVTILRLHVFCVFRVVPPVVVAPTAANEPGEYHAGDERNPEQAKTWGF